MLIYNFACQSTRAIYFAIFFLNPKFRIVKKCANVTCSTYFPVLHTNKKKIYCSTRCANAVNHSTLESLLFKVK
ncbi:CGNR zinc finger domain-containing protein [Candidatus Clostridium radicumherbarum]|uniref:CGNR zinc finger domain-containing protein n=1 Tax=Candidatus Clostridium radicumherbarum TaxID=3381662 RepID=A0ABW8TTP1_9CLOT